MNHFIYWLSSLLTPPLAWAITPSHRPICICLRFVFVRGRELYIFRVTRELRVAVVNCHRPSVVPSKPSSVATRDARESKKDSKLPSICLPSPSWLDQSGASGALILNLNCFISYLCISMILFVIDFILILFLLKITWTVNWDLSILNIVQFDYFRGPEIRNLQEWLVGTRLLLDWKCHLYQTL